MASDEDESIASQEDWKEEDFKAIENHDDIKRLEELLDQHDREVNWTYDNMSPLMMAAQADETGNFEMVKLLVTKYKANVDLRDEEVGCFALQFAAFAGNAKICEFLLEKSTELLNEVNLTQQTLAFPLPILNLL